MRLARGRQADLRGRDAAVAGGADPGADRRPGLPLHGPRVPAHAGPRLLPASQLPQVSTAHQVLPHVDSHERTDDDARVRDKCRATAGDSTRGESRVHDMRSQRHVARLQDEAERGRHGARRHRRYAELGAGRGQWRALRHMQKKSAAQGPPLPLVPDLYSQQGISLQMVLWMSLSLTLM